MKKRHPKLLTVLLIVFLAWAGGLALFVVSTLTMSPEHIDETTDAIVVLTGGTHRVEYGLGLFAEGKARHLFISGVHKDVRKNEITALWKGETALPPCCITLGQESTTTTQNATEVRNWIAHYHYTSIRLVTSNYHMNRALLEMRHALPGVQIIPNPFVQDDLNASHWHFWEILFGEYHKTLFRTLALAFIPRLPLPEGS